jgi:succinoglycan biosynthesis transport protein ExoP
MGIREYLRVIVQGWIVVLACLAVGLGGAAAVTLVSPSQYRSQSTILVSVPTAQESSGSEISATFASAQARVASYLTLTTTSVVLQPVIEELGLDLSVSELAEEITVTAIPQTVVMTIDVTDPDPVNAAAIADAVAESLRSYVTRTLEVPIAGGESRIDIQIVETAAVPDSAISPDSAVFLVLGGATGLILGIGIVVLRSLADARVRSSREVARATPMQILQSIPWDKRVRRDPLLLATETSGAFAESFRMLRTSLEFGASAADSTILVSSPVPGDGKSVIAANLGIALAGVGRSVVVVDADLRSPSIGEMFSAPAGATGLSAVLQDDRVPLATEPTRIPGLSVLVAGTTPVSSTELLTSPRMVEVIQVLAEHFDHVIVDAPPALVATDSVILSRSVGSTIIVVGAGVSTSEDVVSAVEKFADVGGHVAGIVVSQSRSSAEATGSNPRAIAHAEVPVGHRG